MNVKTSCAQPSRRRRGSCLEASPSNWPERREAEKDLGKEKVRRASQIANSSRQLHMWTSHASSYSPRHTTMRYLELFFFFFFDDSSGLRRTVQVHTPCFFLGFRLRRSRRRLHDASFGQSQTGKTKKEKYDLTSRNLSRNLD